MDVRLTTSASQIVNNYTSDQLIQTFKEYGEERYAKQIVQHIVKVRTETPITTTLQLAEIVEQVYSNKIKHSKESRKNKNRVKRIHPATRIFQALRIEVNGELNNLVCGLDAAVSVLKPVGHLCVISFHSLEDRIVKQKIRQYARTCICQPKTPVCICKHEKRLDVVTRKPVLPSQSEIDANPRSRSAKLRVAMRV
jgi:16S rRNA (cytosine1402-N4)-methyltransferase